jgi:beta-lactamase regulating signal transducer with metallopeptidase domain
MNAFLQYGLSNTAMAGALALVALIVARRWKNPHVARAFWLLVLVKLLVPPLISVSLPFATEAKQVEHDLSVVTLASANATEEAVSVSPVTATVYAAPASAWNWEILAWALVVFWFIGSAFVFLTGYMRIARFHRLLKQASSAPDSVEQLHGYIAGLVGLRRVPLLRVIPGDTTPFVWPLGWRCSIVLPESLVRTLDRESLSNILLHELAHVRRGDHLVRWLEVAATVLYWWNPVLWLARRELHKSEEASCDAWVTAEFPARRRSYAFSLLNAAEKLLPCPRPVPLAVAAFSRRSLLTQRIEHLLHRRPAKRLSAVATLLIAAIATIVWPCGASWGVTQEQIGAASNSTEQTPADSPESAVGPATTTPAAVGAAKQARFVLAAVSEDGSAVQIVRSVNQANKEVISDYKWGQIEVFNAGGEKLSRKAARKALADRRMVVVISGTRPIEAYAPVWKALAADTPVIRLIAPGTNQVKRANPPAQTRSIEHLGGKIKQKE